MKRFKKLLAFAVSCTMILGTMSMMSFADPTESTGTPSQEMTNPVFDASIEVTGLETGDVVKFYKVLEWAGSRPAGQSEEDYKKEVYGGWKFASPFVGTELGSFENNAKAIETIIGDPGADNPIDYQLTSEIAGKLARQAVDKGATALDGSTVEGGSSKLEINQTDVGLYMALITPADAKMVYNPVFVSADFETTKVPGTSSQIADSVARYSNAGAAKKSKPGTNKEAEYDPNTSYDKDWKSARPGEKVKFTVDFTIPGYGDVYVTPKFKVTDKLTDMKLDAAPTVKDVAASNYTVTGGQGDDLFTIEFTADYLKTVKVPTKVYVEYTAVIDKDVELNVNTETNEIWIEYSHDPTNEDDFDVKKDTTNSYTYTINADLLGGYEDGIQYSGVEIIKVGVDAHGNPINSETKTTSYISGDGWEGPLAGAIFKLYTDEDCTKEYKYGDGTSLPEIKSGADGRFKIEGLDAGTYYLREEQAPSGYIKATDPVEIKIEPHFTTESVTEYYTSGAAEPWSYTETAGAKKVTYDMEVLQGYDVFFNGIKKVEHRYYNEGKKEIKVSDTGIKELPSSIINTKGVELPATGGMGTTIFYVIGAVLVLGAGILLVTRRRMDVQ